MDAEHRLAGLLAVLRTSGIRVVHKRNYWHQRAIDRLLRVVTFGAQTRYLDGYVTTIRRSIYLPNGWSRRPAGDRWATLCHERVHLKQFDRFGMVLMSLAYLLLPLPFGLAWCRMRFERAAYEETIRCHHSLGGRAATNQIRDHVIAQFVSGSYGWMWPFRRSLERWYDRFVDELGKNPAPTA